MLHDPEVLILDEPTDGLDPNQKHEVRELIRKMSSNKVVVLSTHILEEVEAVCSRAIIIANGRIVADATPAELLARSDQHNAVSLQIDGDIDVARGERTTRSLREQGADTQFLAAMLPTKHRSRKPLTPPSPSTRLLVGSSAGRWVRRRRRPGRSLSGEREPSW